MQYRIEGSGVSAEIEIDFDGVKLFGLIRMDGGEWTFTTSTGTTWLAAGRLSVAAAIHRAMDILLEVYETSNVIKLAVTGRP